MDLFPKKPDAAVTLKFPGTYSQGPIQGSVDYARIVQLVPCDTRPDKQRRLPFPFPVLVDGSSSIIIHQGMQVRQRRGQAPFKSWPAWFEVYRVMATV